MDLPYRKNAPLVNTNKVAIYNGKGHEPHPVFHGYNKILNNSTSLAALGALAHRLQCPTACKIQKGLLGAPKWPTVSGKGSTPRLLDPPKNFR